MLRPLVPAILIAVSGAASADARADDFHIDSDTSFQAYEVRSPGTAAMLARRRLVQTLGLSWTRAFGDANEQGEPRPRITAGVRLRLDQDFGSTCLVTRELCVRATEPGYPGSYHPLASDTDVDAPEVWVEMGDLPLDARVRVGRHLHFGPEGIVRIDGGTARVEPLDWLAFEAFGGALVRTTSLAGTGAFEPQGILRLDLPDDLEAGRADFVSEPVTTWAVGGSVSLGEERYARLRVGYRETFEPGALVARYGAVSLASQPIDAVRADVSGALDFVDGTLFDAVADVAVDPAPWLVLRVRAEHHVPRFDRGSIWAYFDLVPITEGLVSATVALHRRVRVGVGARGRIASLGEADEETDEAFEGHAAVDVGGFDVRLYGDAWSGSLGPVAFRPARRRAFDHVVGAPRSAGVRLVLRRSAATGAPRHERRRGARRSVRPLRAGVPPVRPRALVQRRRRSPVSIHRAALHRGVEVSGLRRGAGLPASGLLAAVAVAGVLGGMAQGQARLPETRPSPIVFPPRAPGARAAHAIPAHARLRCERCHEGASRSDRAADVLTPRESSCLPCHAGAIARSGDASGDDAERCRLCHVDAAAGVRAAPATREAPRVHFSHAVHARAGARCLSCHSDIDTTADAPPHMPTMRSCFDCHGGPSPSAPSTCTTCHVALPDGRMRSRFEEGWLDPPSWLHDMRHDADFIVRHRWIGADRAELCATCHTESDCSDCHDGRVRPARRVHPNDYLTIHPQMARRDEPRCTSCHSTQTFCAECHARLGISTTSAPDVRASRRYHPPPEVWTRGPALHGREARRSMTTCTSCHSERDCVTCHGVLGIGAGLSPHPPGFERSCRPLLESNNRACRTCHGDVAALARLCR